MTHRILRQKELMEKVGLSKTTLWRFVKDKEFPAPIDLGAKSVGWVEAEVDQWIENRMAKRQIIDDKAANASLSM